MKRALVVIRKRAGEAPYPTIIDNTENGIEREVGGPAAHLVLQKPRARLFYVDGDHAPANLKVSGDAIIYGDVVVVGYDQHRDDHRTLTANEGDAIISWLRERAPWDSTSP